MFPVDSVDFFNTTIQLYDPQPCEVTVVGILGCIGIAVLYVATWHHTLDKVTRSRQNCRPSEHMAFPWWTKAKQVGFYWAGLSLEQRSEPVNLSWPTSRFLRCQWPFSPLICVCHIFPLDKPIPHVSGPHEWRAEEQAARPDGPKITEGTEASVLEPTCLAILSLCCFLLQYWQRMSLRYSACGWVHSAKVSGGAFLNLSETKYERQKGQPDSLGRQPYRRDILCVLFSHTLFYYCRAKYWTIQPDYWLVIARNAISINQQSNIVFVAQLKRQPADCCFGHGPDGDNCAVLWVALLCVQKVSTRGRGSKASGPICNAHCSTVQIDVFGFVWFCSPTFVQSLHFWWKKVTQQSDATPLAVRLYN